MSKIYVVSDDAIIEKLEYGIAISKLYTGRVNIINQTGHAILELFDGQRSLEEIISILSLRFWKTPDTISKEVETFAEQLLAKGLIIEKHP